MLTEKSVIEDFIHVIFGYIIGRMTLEATLMVCTTTMKNPNLEDSPEFHHILKSVIVSAFSDKQPPPIQ